MKNLSRYSLCVFGFVALAFPQISPTEPCARNLRVPDDRASGGAGCGLLNGEVLLDGADASISISVAIPAENVSNRIGGPADVSQGIIKSVDDVFYRYGYLIKIVVNCIPIRVTDRLTCCG
jgi:hypothetical protein